MNTQEKTTLQREIIAGEQDINNVLTTSKNIAPIFHTHYVNMTNGNNGISALISEILTEREAVFPKGIEKGEFRKIAMATSMFASEIFEEVQNRFSSGSIRYPQTTIDMQLSRFMFLSGKVGKIKLKGNEDKPRTCCKPRIKYYLIQQ